MPAKRRKNSRLSRISRAKKLLRSPAVNALIAQNLRSTLDELYVRYNRHPSRAAAKYIEAVKAELAEVS